MGSRLAVTYNMMDRQHQALCSFCALQIVDRRQQNQAAVHQAALHQAALHQAALHQAALYIGSSCPDAAQGDAVDAVLQTA